MIPSPWIAFVLGLAAFRLTRLIGWDDLPIVVRARRWATGEHTTSSGSINASMRLSTEEMVHSTAYRRPLLADMLACPWCLGWWVSLALYAAWVFEPTWTLYCAAPLALNVFIAVFARFGDPT